MFEENEECRFDKTVSVALATCNGAAYLPEQLESLRYQTYPIEEVVVSDDCSSDETLSILDQYKGVLPLKIYANEISLGVTENFKRAVSLCRGDYIALCDQDDFWYPDKLAKSVQKMRKIDINIPALVYSDLEVVDSNLKFLNRSFWQLTAKKPFEENFVTLLAGNTVTGCTVLMNQMMAVEMQKMPANAAMHDHWIALIAYGIGRYGIINEPTMKYRQHGHNVTKTEKVTLQVRLKRTIKLMVGYGEAKNFYQGCLVQAEEFQRIYLNRLPDRYQKALNVFVALKHKPTYFTKLYVSVTRHLMKGLFR